MRKLVLLLPLLLMSCAAVPSRDGRHGLFDGTETGSATDSASSEGVLGDSGTCAPLTEADRARVLELADPVNFPKTRYRKGSGRPLEKETDCSHFVYQVYKRAGLPYGFRTTSQLPGASEFEVLPESAARPGDLMLFRGHVGIVTRDGRIISALVTRHRRRKSSIGVSERESFRTFRGKRFVLRYKCHPAAADRTLASVPPTQAQANEAKPKDTLQP
jgi:NlpC/P60 family